MDKPVQNTCTACGAPLNEKTECTCDSTVCAKCCKCPDDCTCGCKEKSAQQPVG